MGLGDLPIPDAIGGLLGLDGNSWEDRLENGGYASPGGKDFRFDYTRISRKTKRRDTAFEYAGVDGAYVQQNGHGARRYPLLCYFTGDNHDLIATGFEAALLEPGVGRLTHPLYGTFDATPFGEIERRNDLVTEANQSIVQVTFWTTIGAVYPTGDGDPESEILAALGDFDAAAASQFEGSTALGGAIDAANAASTVRGFLQDVSAAIGAVSDTVSGARRKFEDQQRLINFGIDVLIGQPLLLAQQIQNLIKAPARALSGIRSRLEGYLALARRIFGSKAAQGVLAGTIAGTPGAIGSTLTTLHNKTSNDVRIADLFATTAVAATALAVVETEFRTKPEALAAAEFISEMMDEVTEWREAAIGTNLEQVDTGEAYQALQRVVALVSGYLVQVSFTLLPERKVTLDRPRTVIDLAAELYGSVDDDVLELLISSNGLTGSEILEIPRGRSISYYV